MNQSMKQINTIYLALLGGQMLFAAVVIILVQGNNLDNRITVEGLPMQIIVPAMLLGGVGIAYVLNNQRMQHAQNMASKANLGQKLNHYRVSVLLRSAIIEAVNLFSIIAALILNNLSYLIYFGVGLLAYLYFKPSNQKFINAYRLDGAEASQL